MGRVKEIIWTLAVVDDLEQIHFFYADKSISAATRIIENIIDKAESLKFTEQYQKDDLNPNYHRLFVRHFKLVYKIGGNNILILRAFDCRSNPDTMILDDDELILL